MTVHRPPRKIYAPYAAYTAQAFRDLAQRAEKGKIIGGGLALINSDRQPELMVVGYCKHRPREGHWAVMLLQQQLLYDNAP